MAHDSTFGYVLGRVQELIGGMSGFDGCREWALDGEPLAGFILLDDSVPAARPGRVGTELNHVGVRKAFGDQPPAPGGGVVLPEEASPS
jgi:hypothetical protein